jgi:hypothetical protein
MGGRLEHEIRLLPQVLSCSFSKDDYVVVLIDPSADPLTIQLAVERILQNAGSEATVRVIGPPEAAAIAATRTMSPLVVTASIATVAAIGIGALVGGLAAVEHPKALPAHKTPIAAASAAPFDSVDVLRGLQFPVRRSGSPERPPVSSLPVETPDHPRRILPISLGAVATPVRKPAASQSQFRPLQAKTVATLPRASSFRAAPAGRRGHHAGKGLPHWSEVLLPPHPSKQRGRGH